VNDQDVTPRGWVQRSAFGALACRANEPVSVDELADAVWPTRKPRSPRNALQIAVHRMRANSGRPELIAHNGDGYQLMLTTDELDAARFVAQATSARTSAQHGDLLEAKRLFDTALHLWRGPMLPDLQDVPIIADTTQWLTHQHQSVVEDAADVGVALGDSELIGSLNTWTRLYPLSERLRSRLMMALYAAGRLADALNAYQATHRLWIRELGIEPGPELRDLHQHMLNGTPAEELRRTIYGRPAGGDQVVGGASTTAADVHPSRTIPRQLPRDVGDFVGRAGELAAVHAALVPGGVCVISGQAGVGKTTLAVRPVIRWPNVSPTVSFTRTCGRSTTTRTARPPRRSCAHSASTTRPSHRAPAIGRLCSGRCWHPGASWWCWTTRTTRARYGSCFPAPVIRRSW